MKSISMYSKAKKLKQLSIALFEANGMTCFLCGCPLENPLNVVSRRDGDDNLWFRHQNCKGLTGKRISIYSKVRKLKILILEILEQTETVCYFCAEIITEPLDMTEHHLNGDHYDDGPENKSFSHQTCHRQFHAGKTFRKYYAKVKA